MSTHIRTRFAVAALLAIMVVCSIALPVSGIVQAATGKAATQTGILTQTTRLYAGASATSRTLLSLKKGTKVTVISRSGVWYKAALTTKTGYVLCKYVKIVPAAKPVAKPVTKPITKPVKVALTISAAVSMSDAMNKIQKLYQTANPNVTLTMNYGSSGALEQQIEHGAPADIFVSAANKQMDQLEAKNLVLAGTRKVLVQNHLVLIIPKGSTAVASFDDLTKSAVKFLAIGEPSSVPAGQYAQESLTKMGLWDKLQPKLVMGKDVRTVLTYVASKNADAGLVYSTDALTSKDVRVIATAPEDSHSPIVYPAAVISASKNQAAAKAFEAYLSGPLATAIFRGYGFAVGN